MPRRPTCLIDLIETMQAGSIWGEDGAEFVQKDIITDARLGNMWAVVPSYHAKAEVFFFFEHIQTINISRKQKQLEMERIRDRSMRRHAIKEAFPCGSRRKGKGGPFFWPRGLQSGPTLMHERRPLARAPEVPP